MNNIPNPEKACSCLNSDKVTYIKPTIKNKNIIVGDFSYFVIGERGNRQVRHLRELYAMSDKTAFLMLERVDCVLTDRHAIRGLAIR